MALVDKITRITAKANNLERRLLMSSGSRCFLLKRKNESSQFEVVIELASGWKVEYSNFNMMSTLFFADTSGDFSDKIAQASWIAYGVLDTGDRVDVYKMDPQRKDVVPPVANDANWKIYLTRDPNLRFTVDN